MSHKVAIVTGGTRGIGRAVAHRLGAGGFLPVLLYRERHDDAREACEALAPLGPVRAFPVDLGDAAAVERVAHDIHAIYGRVDVLINNAYTSTGPAAKTHEIPLEQWEAGLRNNLTGPFLITKAVLPWLLQSPAGRIVFIGSLAARGEPGRAVYTVAKNGLIGLVRTMAREYASFGLTVNMVSPGYTQAGAFERLDPAVQDRSARSVPMRRLGRAEEIAEAVYYFVGPESAYTTGQILGVDGGAP